MIRGINSPENGLAIGATEITVGVAVAGTTTPAATFDLSLMGGQKAFAIAAGSLTGKGETFRLMLVDTTEFPWQTAQVMPN